MRLWAKFVAILAACFSVCAATATAQQYPHSKLFKSTRALLALARVRGSHDFGVIIASGPGANDRVAAAILAAGGKVERQVDAVDYLRASLPLSKVEPIANLPDVVAIDADAPITDLNVASSNATAASPSPSPKPARTEKDEAPLLHPYLPGIDMGTYRLRAAHPTFDGRGATVALIDSTPDFLLPEFAHAKRLDGHDVPKIVDMLTSTDSKTEEPDYSEWINMSTIVNAVGDSFSINGINYTSPKDGSFRFGYIRNTPLFQALIGKLLDPQPSPKPKKNAPLFAVLWDERSNNVWVDTSNNHDFSKAAALTDYAVHHDYGTFAIRPKDAEARKTIGFVVQTDRVRHSVAILLGAGDHATGAGGSAVGAGLNHGSFDNIAPGARLLSLSPNYNSHGLIEAVIEAEQDPRVDLVCIEVISAEEYGLKDGRFTQSVIYDRLVKRYNKPILQPADNDKGLSKVEEAGIPDDVLSIGAYQSQDSYRIDAGIDVPLRDNLHFVSAYGPANNGAFKPTILAPSGYVSLGLGYEASRALKGVYNLPPGYQMFGGTSQATPTAAGAVAILMSAARQTGFAFTVPHLVRALENTARYLTTLPAYKQGPGLIQVDRAYAELARLASHEPDTIVLRAPIQTIVSRFLPTPDIGVGLYEREGWAPGMRGVRTLELTRTSGVRGDKQFDVELVDNDGTFVLPSLVHLKLDVPTDISATVAPLSAGVHSAILRLLDPSTGDAVLNAYLAVVAAEQFTSANNYTVMRHFTVGRPGDSSVFVNVPEGAQALRVDLQAHRQLDFEPILPDATEAGLPTNSYLGGSQINSGVFSYFFPHPQAGVWELELQDLNDTFAHEKNQQHPLRASPVELTASIIDVSATNSGSQLVVQSNGASIPNAIFTREAASFAQHSGVIHKGQQIVYSVDVPEGATRVGARLESTSGASSDLDLYIFDCTKKCRLKYRTANYDGHNEASVESPARGKWKIVIDAYATPNEGTSYRYTDYVTSPLVAIHTQLGRHVGSLFSLGLIGNDMGLYDNEEGGGPVEPRKGQNPITVTTFPLLGGR